mmetsp:Transcript_27477/g.12814  ORF Transcript_27477/g.12814 Transcript_27477/m.12814 type:complete len:96 (+) Transcript_27477:263-550(+)
MNFLHNNSKFPAFCHGNLKPSNVFIDTRHYSVKISDIRIYSFSKNNEDLPYYSAPEVLDDLTQPSSDVWSYACVLIELFSERKVWLHMSKTAVYK